MRSWLTLVIVVVMSTLSVALLVLLGLPYSALTSAQANPYERDADLSITKTDSPDPVAAGADLTYEIMVKNETSGAFGATGVIVMDTFPGGVTFKSAAPSQGVTNPVSGGLTWEVGELIAGQIETLDIVVTVDAGTPDGTVLTNAAVVQGEQLDPNPSNNTATATTTVTSPALCTLALTPSYAAGTLTVDILVGTSVPAKLSLWRIARAESVSLASVVVEVTEPPITTTITATLGPSGTAGVLATLTRSGLGIICSDFKTVETGSPP